MACLEEPPHFLVLDAHNPGCTFLWSTGETSQAIRGTEYQTYFVTITTSLDCSVEESIALMEYCPSAIFLPNSFTPDGNGANDVFYPVGNNIASVHLLIFDRWGELVFDGKDGNAAWDGTVNGQPAKEDVYVWKLTYSYFEDVGHTSIGTPAERVGHVTVLR